MNGCDCGHDGLAPEWHADTCGKPPTEPTHVIDRHGHVWAVVRDGGMVTRADYAGVQSAGIAWLEAEAGPLLPFDSIAYRRSYPRAWPS